MAGQPAMGIDILGYATVDCTDLLSNLSPGVAGGHGIHAGGATTQEWDPIPAVRQ